MIQTMRRLLFPTKQEREEEKNVIYKIKQERAQLEDRVQEIHASLDNEREWLKRKHADDE